MQTIVAWGGWCVCGEGVALGRVGAWQAVGTSSADQLSNSSLGQDGTEVPPEDPR